MNFHVLDVVTAVVGFVLVGAGALIELLAVTARGKDRPPANIGALIAVLFVLGLILVLQGYGTFDATAIQ